jgi:hypothetical protein
MSASVSQWVPVSGSIIFTAHCCLARYLIDLFDSFTLWNFNKQVKNISLVIKLNDAKLIKFGPRRALALWSMLSKLQQEVRARDLIDCFCYLLLSIVSSLHFYLLTMVDDSGRQSYGPSF